jgi:hypothetical protein
MLYLLLSIILAAAAWVGSGLLFVLTITDSVKNAKGNDVYVPFILSALVLACFSGIYILSGPIILGLAIFIPIAIYFIRFLFMVVINSAISHGNIYR